MLIAAVLAVGSFAQQIGSTCAADDDCDYSCCSVETQIKDEGKCVEISDYPRCKERHHNYLIALSIYLTVFFVSLAFCGSIKHKQV